MKSCVILLSGGQDSTTCLFWAIKKFDTILAVGFDYGQKHKQELRQANLIAEKVSVPYKIFNIENLLPKSSLTQNTDHNKQHHINNNLPASFTSGRNIIFLSIAGSYASENKINHLVIGVSQVDYSGYPDCRRSTIKAMEKVLSIGYGSGKFIIHTPLINYSKAETWKFAKKLGCLDIIKNHTLTDYNGNVKMNEWGMGKPDNPASILRMNGYYEAKEKGWV